MQQIGRGRPNLSFLFRTTVPKTYLIDQTNNAVAGAVVTATRTDTAAVAGATTAVSSVTAGSVRFANVSGVSTCAIETFATKVSYAEVLGETTANAGPFALRADTADVNGAVTAGSNLLAPALRITQWINRAPRGRF